MSSSVETGQIRHLGPANDDIGSCQNTTLESMINLLGDKLSSPLAIHLVNNNVVEISPSTQIKKQSDGGFDYVDSYRWRLPLNGKKAIDIVQSSINFLTGEVTGSVDAESLVCPNIPANNFIKVAVVADINKSKIRVIFGVPSATEEALLNPQVPSNTIQIAIINLVKDDTEGKWNFLPLTKSQVEVVKSSGMGGGGAGGAGVDSWALTARPDDYDSVNSTLAEGVTVKGVEDSLVITSPVAEESRIIFNEVVPPELCGVINWVRIFNTGNSTRFNMGVQGFRKDTKVWEDLSLTDEYPLSYDNELTRSFVGFAIDRNLYEKYRMFIQIEALPSVPAEPSVLTVARGEYTDKDFTEQGTNSFGEIGRVFWSATNTVPFGGVKCLGQEESNALYNGLLNWAIINNCLLTRAEYDEYLASHGGQCPYIAIDSTDDATMRMPTITKFVEGTDTSEEIGNFDSTVPARGENAVGTLKGCYVIIGIALTDYETLTPEAVRTPWAVNSGNTNVDGDPNLLTFSGRFVGLNLGEGFPELVITSASGQTSFLEFYKPAVVPQVDGRHFVFIDWQGNLWTSQEMVRQQKGEPTDKIDGTLWLDNSGEPLEFKRWSGAKNEWEALDSVLIGHVIVQNGVITSVSDYPFNRKNTTNYAVGTIFASFLTKEHPPFGAVLCDGAEYNAWDFLDFWGNYLITPKVPVISFTEWQADVDQFGNCAKFAIDVAGNKFKVPLVSDGTYITGGDGRSLEAGLPNITGNTSTRHQDGRIYGGLWDSGSQSLAYPDNNAFDIIRNNSVVADPPNAGTAGKQSMVFDASRSNPIYGKSETVQPKSVTVRFFVQLVNTEVGKSAIDWSRWVEDLNNINKQLRNKANVALDNLSEEAVKKLFRMSCINTNAERHDFNGGTSTQVIPFDGTLIIASSNYENQKRLWFNNIVLAVNGSSSPGSCFFFVQMNVKKGDTFRFENSQNHVHTIAVFRGGVI